MRRALAALAIVAWASYTGAGEGFDEDGVNYRYWTFSLHGRRVQIEIGDRS